MRSDDSLQTVDPTITLVETQPFDIPVRLVFELCCTRVAVGNVVSSLDQVV